MSSPVVWLVLVSQTVLSAVLLAGAGLGFAFESEGRHGRALPPLAQGLMWLAVLVAVLPLLLSLVWLVRRLGGWSATGAVVAAPLSACLVGVPVFFGLMVGSETAAHAARERAEADAIAAARARGEVCAVVALDPRSTEAEQVKCLDVLAALAPAPRREALLVFVDRGFKSHFDPEQRPVFAPALQARFVSLFFDAALDDAQVLTRDETRWRLFDCLREVFLMGWSPEAQKAAAEVVPKVRARAAGLEEQKLTQELSGLLDEMEHYVTVRGG